MSLRPPTARDPFGAVLLNLHPDAVTVVDIATDTDWTQPVYQFNDDDPNPVIDAQLRQCIIGAQLQPGQGGTSLTLA